MAIRKRCLYCGNLVRTNNYCSACNLSQAFLEKAYNTSSYYYNIGLDKAKVKDLSGAIDSLKMSLRYNKHNVDARNLIGLIYYELGDTVLAIGHWVMSVNYNPKDNIASRYLKELKNDPLYLENVSSIAKMFNQSLQFAGRRDFDLAFVQLKKIIALNPKYVNAYLLMALIYIEQKREGSAKKCLARVLGIDRTNNIAIHYLREMGETEENIFRMSDAEIENEVDDKDKYYGMEDDDVKIRRPAVKIEPDYSRKKETSERSKRKKEMKLAQYSNVYMLTGMLIGILVVGGVILPLVLRNQKHEISKVHSTYTAQLASNNTTIEVLNNEIKDLSDELELTIEENALLEQTNAQLRSKLSKEAVEAIDSQAHDDELEISNKGTMTGSEIQRIINNE